MQTKKKKREKTKKKINQFIDSFESMVIKFKKADSNLNLGFRINLTEKRKKCSMVLH